MQPLSDPVMNAMEKFLDLSVRRQEVISSNLANIETPGYRARQLNFEQLFRSEVESQVPLRATRDRHLSGRPVLIREPEVEVAPTDSMGNDGNNVDLDKELTTLAENVLKFSAVTQLYQLKIQQLRSSIREGRV